jgi:hypothetical protein
MYRTMPNTHQPRLRLGTTRKESVRSGKHVVPDLKLARLNVNRHDPADITFFHLRPHLSLVECLTTSGEFFFNYNAAAAFPCYYPFANFLSCVVEITVTFYRHPGLVEY